jgi:tetratricopeptide (TPR) repeat protein
LNHPLPCFLHSVFISSHSSAAGRNPITTLRRNASLFLVLLVSPLPVLAAPPDSLPSGLQFAESLFAQRAYHSAVTAYKRFLFFDPASALVPYASFRMALAEERDSNYIVSIDILDQLSRQSPEPTIKTNAGIALGLLYQKHGYADLARFQLRILLDKTDGPDRQRVHAALGTVYLAAARWDSARAHFSACAQAPDTSLARTAQGILTELDRVPGLPSRAHWLAGTLSLAVPGAGQLYTGRGWEALGSFTLNLIFGAWTVYYLRDRDYRTAGLVYLAFWSRWHIGGVMHAAKTAREYNHKTANSFISNIRAHYDFDFFMR